MSKRNWVMAILASVGLLGATTTSAVASATTSNAAGVGGTLTISNAEYLWTCGFNPFNPSDTDLSVGAIYEPLMFVDTLDNAKVTPWLATSATWSNGNKVLTFTIRKGVKWTDGQPLTAADVAFTFNLLKKYPALDLNTIWSVLSERGAKRQRRRDDLQDSGGPLLLLHRGPGRHHPRARLGIGQKPGHLQGRQPRRHRTVHRVELHGTERDLHAQPPLLAAGAAQGSRRSSTPPLPRTRRPTRCCPPAARSGAASSSPTSRPSTCPRARTTISGSRR